MALTKEQQEYINSHLTYESAIGNLTNVKELLSLGANPNCMIENHTPLAGASGNCHIDVINELLKAGADVNGSNGLALRYASSNGQIPVIDLLLSLGADINVEGGSPLISAGIYDKFDAFKHLLERGADFNFAMSNIHHKEVREKVDKAYSKLLAAQEQNLLSEDLIEVMNNKSEIKEPKKTKGLRV
jgi:ankyrin repeat protein